MLIALEKILGLLSLLNLKLSSFKKAFASVPKSSFFFHQCKFVKTYKYFLDYQLTEYFLQILLFFRLFYIQNYQR